MAKRKRYGAKVVRSKRNMYKARKSGVRKGIEIVGMLVLVGGICFLGYSLGAPLIDYFTSGKAEETASVTSFTSTLPSETAPTEQTAAPEETAEVTTAAPRFETAGMSAYRIPTGALMNSASLSAVIAQAKNGGYSSVVLELKDDTGYLYYKTSLEALADEDIVKGGLSLAEIVAVCERAGVTPVAEISTLKDSKVQSCISGIGYRFADDSYTWLDAAPENGGKQWANPQNKETVDYIGDLAEEIANGGIKAIMLKNTVYPELKPYDKTILPENVQDDNRYRALVNVVKECASRTESSGVKIIVEATASDILAGYDGLAGSAELLRGKSQLTGVSVAVIYDRESFGEELKLGKDTSTPLPKDISQQFSTVCAQLSRYTGELELIACLDSGISASELDEIRAAYSGIGCAGEVIG